MRYVVVAAPPDVIEPADLARLPAAADVVELRLDLLQGGLTSGGCARWCGAALRRGRRLLVTVRSRGEGGASDLGASATAALLRASGGHLLDVEGPALAALVGGGPLPHPGQALVLSRHGSLEPLPPAPGLPVLAVKRVARVADAAALGRLLEILREPPGDGRAVMPTGPLAALRVLDPHAALLYGSAGHAVVEGQPALLDLLDHLRAGEVTPRARLFGLLGTPPAASPSPMLHNAVFRARALDAVHVPLPGLSLSAALALPFQGFSVTTPHKAEALSAAAGATREALAVGAANTLTRGADGGWQAHNTDVEALARHLMPVERGRTAVVYGAGGYARAALAAARAHGLGVRLLSRDPRAGQALARAVGAAWGGTRYRREPGDGALVNASPAGADGRAVEALDTDLEGLRVLDAPYAAEGATTWLARVARERRAAAVVDGLTLLLAQAHGQARLFSGEAPDPETLWLALRPCSNLVLVGLRGAGKTSVGRALARRLGRPFVDLDAEVLRRTGQDAAGFLRRRGPGQGWGGFRLAERDALLALEGRRGLVIATGGGVVEHGRNLATLRGLGLCVWLEVPAALAAARVASDPTPRPPLGADGSPAEEAVRLLRRRAPRYALVAAARVDASGPVGPIVETVRERWLDHERALRARAGAR